VIELRSLRIEPTKFPWKGNMPTFLDMARTQMSNEKEKRIAAARAGLDEKTMSEEPLRQKGRRKPKHLS